MTEITRDIREDRGVPRLVKLVLYLLALMVFLLSCLAAVVYFYDDEIKASIINGLNKNLRAEVQVQPSDIDVTILRTFPDCALQFKKVLMLEAIDKKQRDTLVFAEQIRLHFDFLDIWRGNYRLHKLSIDGATLKIALSSAGEPNYIFWKNTSQNTQGATSFSLNNVRITNCKLFYENKQADISTALQIKDLGLNGDFASDKYKLSANTDLLINGFIQKGKLYLEEKRLVTALDLNVNNEAFVISSALVKLNELELNVNGGFSYRSETLSDLQLSYQAPNLQITSLISLLPANEAAKIKDYQSSGRIFIEGELAYNDNVFDGKATFGANNARIDYLPGGTSVEQLNFSGNLLHGKIFELEIKDLRAMMDEGQISGSLRVRGTDDPMVRLETRIKSSLAALHGFLPLDTLEKISGDLEIDLQLAGLVSDLKQKEFSKNIELNLQAGVRDLIATFKHDKQSYRIASCKLRARKGEIEVKDLHLKRGSSDLLINGAAPGLLDYFSGEQTPLRINGSMVSEKLVVDDFLPEASSNGNNGAADLIPSRLILSAQSKIRSLAFGKFRATDVSGQIDIRDQKMMVSDLNLRTMQGSANINALADNSKGGLDVSVESSLKRINIQELFVQMNNFGQSTLSDQHIRGFATAEVSFSGRWNNKLENDPASIKTEAEIKIDQGELIAFKPLSSLGRFIDVKDLEHVKFSQLNSNVEIEGQQIRIPRTSIRNTAINLDFYGSHSFEHDIDYHFQLLLSDLIAARKNKSNQGEFGEIMKDSENNRGVYIVMSGNLDDPKIRYDRQGLQQKIKNDLQNEKQNIKGLLKEEFGLFKKSAPAEKPVTETTVFKIEENSPNPAPKKQLVLKKREEEDF